MCGGKVQQLHSPHKTTAITLSAASAILWGIAIAGIWVQVPQPVRGVDVSGAATTAMISALLWLARALFGRVDREQERFRRRDEHDDVYIQAIAWLTRPASAPRRTGPLRRVR
jgi:hypothetical protein